MMLSSIPEVRGEAGCMVNDLRVGERQKRKEGEDDYSWHEDCVPACLCAANSLLLAALWLNGHRLAGRFCDCHPLKGGLCRPA